MFAYIFNFYDFLILNVATLSILLSIPLLTKRDRVKSDLLLSGFLLNQGLLSLYTVFFYNENTQAMTFEFMGAFEKTPFVFCIAMQGLLLYWYSLSMTQQKNKLKFWINLYALIMFTLHVFGMMMQVTKESMWLYIYTEGGSFFRSYSIILGILALIKLKQHEQAIRHRFSNIDQLSLHWLWYCCLGFVITWGLSVVGSLASIWVGQELSRVIGTILNLPPLILISLMVVFSQKHQISSRNDNERDIARSNEYVPDENTIQHLNELMQSVKIYQDPDLRLDGIADSLDMNPRQVSTLISKVHKANFYDFVNAYRVKDAASQLRMPENANKSIQRVFEDAGFNSKSTFNTIFKKTLMLTPSEYRAKYIV